jgi:pimeloyl-ACP methyl ester carboxylesterase
MWHEDLQWLAKAGFRAIALELPGFGEAGFGNGPQAPWEDVLQALRRLEVDQAVLVGNSFGAAVALRVAAVAPAAVSGLVLISPPPLALEPSAQLQAAWDAEGAALERGDIDVAVAAVVQAWTLPDAPQALRDRVAAMQRRTFKLQAAAPEPPEAPDPLEEHPELLAALAIPTLAAAGEHDMPDFRAGAEELVNVLPAGRLAVIRGAGHLAPLEAPDAFRQLLLDFLRTSQDAVTRGA